MKTSCLSTTVKHTAASTSSSTSCSRMQAWETLFLLKEYRQTCGLGSSCKYKNRHQALFPPSLSAKQQQFNSNFFLGQSAKLNKALDLCPPPNPSAEAPREGGGLIRHHHAAGVANGTTMVVVFVGWLTLVR